VGFVGQKQARPGHDGPGDGHPLLFAAGQDAAGTFRLGLQAQGRHDGLHPGPNPLLVYPAHPQGQGDVVIDRPIGQNFEVLKNDGDFPAQLQQPGGIQTRQVAAGHADPPFLEGQRPVQDAQQGGLAGAGGPGQKGEPALFHGKGHPAQGVTVTEPMGKVADMDQGLSPSSLAPLRERPAANGLMPSSSPFLAGLSSPHPPRRPLPWPGKPLTARASGHGAVPSRPGFPEHTGVTRRRKAATWTHCPQTPHPDRWPRSAMSDWPVSPRSSPRAMSRATWPPFWPDWARPPARARPWPCSRNCA